jgi:hypothetical protein
MVTNTVVSIVTQPTRPPLARKKGFSRIEKFMYRRAQGTSSNSTSLEEEMGEIREGANLKTIHCLYGS